MNEEKIITSRYRSNNYTTEEIKVLLDLVKRYKRVVLNKSSSATAKILKDTAWAKIESLFNEGNLATDNQWKSAESLRSKWRNLLCLSRKPLDNGSNTDTVLNDVQELQNDVYVTSDTSVLPTLEEMEADGVPIKSADGVWLQCDNKLAEAGDEDADLSSDDGWMERRVRCSNFSPEENKLLIDCVRQEKEFIFNKDGSKTGAKLKSDAWDRVANQFNKRNNSSRSAKVLKTKLDNMKRVLKRGGSVKKFFKDSLGNKHQRLHNEPQTVKVKIEPDVYSHDSDFADDKSDDSADDSSSSDDAAPDPLGSVLRGGAGGARGAGGADGAGGAGGQGGVRDDSKQAAARLQLQLLHYQMETAKLDRQRVLDAIQSESSVRESRALESALRLRAARLQAIVAERAVPATDPARAYRPEEVVAQKYLASDQQVYPM